MNLLKLPPEILDTIVHALVGSSNVAEAVQYRQICRTFNDSILEDLLERASRLNFTQVFALPGYRGLFDMHGGALLTKKVLRLCNSGGSIIQFVDRVVDHVLRQQWLQDSDSERLRFQYTRRICDSVMALDQEAMCSRLTAMLHVPPHDGATTNVVHTIMPAIAAAMGDSKMLLGHVITPSDLYTTGSELFPNALEAAAASGNIDTLSTALAFLKANVKGKPEANSWDDMRSAAHGIGQALRVAIRLHKTEAGNTIFDFLADNRVYRESMKLFFEEKLAKDCMRYGSIDLIYGSFAYSRFGSYCTASNGQLPNFTVSHDEELFLFKHGHPSALRALIKNGLFDPNVCKQSSSPLHYALSKRNYKMARVLLTHGADVDGVANNNTGKTALWHAAEDGYVADVSLLLEHGARPVHSDKKHSPLAIAIENHHNMCQFLLSKVHKHGKDYLKRPDLWAIYEDETSERHKHDYMIGF